MYMLAHGVVMPSQVPRFSLASGWIGLLVCLCAARQDHMFDI